MEFLMFVPMTELELDIIESNEGFVEDWYFNLEELKADYGEDSEYQILIFEDFKEIHCN